VLGERRLIYVPADREQPEIPYPLSAGATWRGRISGKVPTDPRVPLRTQIWIRYPVFGVGYPWDGATPSGALQWISLKAVEL
jgi:hypothetical protein